MEHREKEALRYLGYGRKAADEATFLLVQNAFRDLERIAERRSVCRIFEFEQEEDSRMKIGGAEVISKNLGKNLKGCSEVILMGATLGIQTDRMIQRASLRNMAEAVVIQACAAAMLEEYCDEVQAGLEEEMARQGLYLRPRFSPGYGDFPIEYQKLLVRMLDSGKKIGLSLTESCMMVPSKSVTAVIGVSKIKTPCHKQGCEMCTKTDCIYRRDTA